MKDLRAKSYIILFFFIFCFNLCHSQVIRLEGSINDLNGIGLSNANIIAKTTDNTDVKFAITNDEGAYKLNLKKGQSYNLTISHLGYKTKIQIVTFSNHEFILI